MIKSFLLTILLITGVFAQYNGNYSLSFDGEDDYVELGDVLNDLYQPVTFQISFKFDGNGGIGGIMVIWVVLVV